MEKVGVAVMIGAAAAPSVAKTLNSIKNQAKTTVATTSKLEIGKSWADNLVTIEKKIKANENLMTRLGRTTQSIEINRRLVTDLAEAKQQAAAFGINIGNAAKRSQELAREIKKVQATEALKGRREERSDERGKLGVSMAKTAAAGYVYKRVVGGMIDDTVAFEEKMAGVRKVVNFDTAAEFKETSKGLLELSTTMPMAAGGFADIMASAGQAGIAKNELKQFTVDSTKMGVAFDMAADIAGSAMTGMRSIFNLNQKGVVSLGDAYNHLSNNMDATASSIVAVGNRSGSTGRMIGLTGQQVGALSATFLALKTPEEVAGTAMNAMFMKLATADMQGKEFQDTLHGMGLSSKKLKTAIKEDAQGAILSFLESVKNSKDPMNTMGALFGIQYADDITKIVANLDLYKSALSMVANESVYAGSMTREYEARSATTANETVLLKNKMTALSITMGNTLLPGFNTLLNIIGPVAVATANVAEAHPELTRNLIVGAGALIAFKGAVIGAKIVASYAKDIKDTIGFMREFGDSTAWATTKTYALAAGQKIAAGATAIWKGVTAGATIVMKAFNFVMAANPIGLIVLGLVAFGALAYTVYKNWEPIVKWFKDVFSSIGDTIGSIFGTDDKKIDATIEKKVTNEVVATPPGADQGKDAAVTKMLSESGKGKSTDEIMKEFSSGKDGFVPSGSMGGNNSRTISVVVEKIEIHAVNVDAALNQIEDKVRAALKKAFKGDGEFADAYGA